MRIGVALLATAVGCTDVTEPVTPLAPPPPSSEDASPVEVEASVAPAERASFGYLDTPAPRSLDAVGDRISGWALDPDGVARVDLVAGDGTRWPLETGIERADVARVHPGVPGSMHAGFDARVDADLLALRSSHVDVVVTDLAGNETRLGQPLAIGPQRNRWRRLLEERPGLASERFYVLFATSSLPTGGAEGIKAEFAAHESETLRVGMRIPVLYMRTTQGRAADWVFDPDFDTTRMRGAVPVAEDSLVETAAWATGHEVPVLFTLNGGVWGDARGTAPEWDLTDHLEEEPAHCQWNQLDQVLADDDPGLPSAIGGVELARSLTLNVFATDVRRYKKRNLQAAASWVAGFAAAHPELFVGVNLDPDVYVNPFFEGRQWYDYNPDTLRQFRHWLRGDGPYLGEGEPDLSAYRRDVALSLEAFNARAETGFASWDEVDGPRLADARLVEFWKVPHFQVWERFRRHLVDLHYDELSTWTHEAGIARDRIYSSQGFSPRSGLIEPFPITLDDRIVNYDAGGMTLEGALPRDGHIGAILYGDSATNRVEMSNGRSLFATLRAFDPGWAIVEFHTADLHAPDIVPGYGVDYGALRDVFNYGAGFVSPMAWNGINGDHPDHPGFVSFMALRRTPLEDAIRFFLDERANLPRGAILYTFGDFRHAADDGWRIDGGGHATPTRGVWQLVPETGSNRLTVSSPADLPLDPASHDLIVLGLDAAAGQVESVAVEARTASGGPWLSIIDRTPWAERPREPAGVRLPLRWGALEAPSELRLRFTVAAGTTALGLDHVLVYPAAPAPAAGSVPSGHGAAARSDAAGRPADEGHRLAHEGRDSLAHRAQ